MYQSEDEEPWDFAADSNAPDGNTSDKSLEHTTIDFWAMDMGEDEEMDLRKSPRQLSSPSDQRGGNNRRRLLRQGSSASLSSSRTLQRSSSARSLVYEQKQQNNRSRGRSRSPGRRSRSRSRSRSRGKSRGRSIESSRRRNSLAPSRSMSSDRSIGSRGSIASRRGRSIERSRRRNSLGPSRSVSSDRSIGSRGSIASRRSIASRGSIARSRRGRSIERSRRRKSMGPSRSVSSDRSIGSRGSIASRGLRSRVRSRSSSRSRLLLNSPAGSTRSGLFRNLSQRLLGLVKEPEETTEPAVALGLTIVSDSLVIQSLERQLNRNLVGCLVASVVSNSPADRAGIEASVVNPVDGSVVLGDLITHVDGIPVYSPQDLSKAMSFHREGDTVHLNAFRRADPSMLQTIVVRLIRRDELVIPITIGGSVAESLESASSFGDEDSISYEGEHGWTFHGGPDEEEFLNDMDESQSIQFDPYEQALSDAGLLDEFGDEDASVSSADIRQAQHKKKVLTYLAAFLFLLFVAGALLIVFIPPLLENGSSSLVPIEPALANTTYDITKESALLPIKEAIFNNTGVEVAIRIYFSTLLANEQVIYYYITTNNQEAMDDFYERGMILYLTRDDPLFWCAGSCSSPRCRYCLSSTERQRRQRLRYLQEGRGDSVIGVPSTLYPYRLPESYFPGENIGMLLVQEATDEEIFRIVDAAVYDRILDKDRNIVSAPTIGPTWLSSSPTEEEDMFVRVPTIAPAPTVPTNKPTPSPTAFPPTFDYSNAEKSILEVSPIPEASQFFARASQVGLSERFDSNVTLTLLVPSDDAYTSFGLEHRNLSRLVHGTGAPHLFDILSYHIIDGKELRSTDFLHESTYEMSNGKLLTTQSDGGSALVSFVDATNSTSSMVSDPLGLVDIQAENGIIHLLDSVLLPEWTTLDLLRVLEGDGRFSIFLELLERTGLNNTLTEFRDSGVTLFAPIDSAFFDKYLYWALTDDDLATVLLYHMHPGVFQLHDSQRNETIEIKTLATGRWIPVNEGTGSVKDSYIADEASLANNGLVYAVSKVFEPSAPKETNAPTDHPTLPPTPESFAVLENMLAFAQQYSIVSKLQDESSPQYQSVLRLVDDELDMRTSWSDYERLQRYVFGIISFSFNFSEELPSNFFSNATVCEWHPKHTECDGDSVVSIDYSSYGLEGLIPEELIYLTALKSLSMANNRLSGSLPTQMRKLSNLVHLDLKSNQLSSALPAGMYSLTKLTSLDLGTNSFSGTISSFFGRLSSLSFFSVRDNELSGSISAEFSKLSLLTSLDLSFNSLRGDIPQELQTMSALQTLRLTGNKFESIPNSIRWLRSLEVLDLSNNDISGTIYSGLGVLRNLETLNLSSNKFTSKIPTELGQLTRLRDLSLSSNKLSGSIPKELGRLGFLSILRLDHNLLTGRIPNEVSQLTRLETLQLERNALTGELPVALCASSRLQSGTVSADCSEISW